MSMDQLRDLEREAQGYSQNALEANRAADRVKTSRTEHRSWTESWEDLSGKGPGWRGSPLAMSVLNDVMNDMRHDILRIVELRLAAQEREHKVKAAQRRAVLAACILPLPNEASHGTLPMQAES